AAEAELGPTRFMAILHALAHSLPLSEIDGANLRPGERMQRGRHRRHDAHGTAYDQPRRRALAAGGAPLVVAGRAKILLQLMVGAGEIRHRVAVKEAGPVAGG